MIGYTENPKSIVSKLYERDLFSLIQDETEGSFSFFPFLLLLLN